MEGWDLKLNWNENSEQKEPEKESKVQATKRRTTECIVRTDRNIYRRAFSESSLLDAVGINFKDGESYHCITGGDVDGLSYLKAVLRQQNLEYCFFSTWCMASDDILQIGEWLEKGIIKKIDAYVGEIFPGSYTHEYNALKRIITPDIGKIVVFKNHSKIFAGYGDKFHFGIETSANINTNPRTENGCITIGKEIFDFYFQYFKGIKSFE